MIGHWLHGNIFGPGRYKQAGINKINLLRESSLFPDAICFLHELFFIFSFYLYQFGSNLAGTITKDYHGIKAHDCIHLFKKMKDKLKWFFTLQLRQADTWLSHCTVINCKCLRKPDKICPYLDMHEKSWSQNVYQLPIWDGDLWAKYAICLVFSDIYS